MTDNSCTSEGGDWAVPIRVALVSTCPPRQCGIATFTSNLARAMKAADPASCLWWAAINEEQSLHQYGPSVRWRIYQRRPMSYQRVAAELNESNIDVVSVQHEFGLYGIWGETFTDHLAPFLDTLRKPLVTTLHTVLPAPSPSVWEAVRRIGSHSRALVVMAHRARSILEQQYNIDPAKVHVIPHGVPPIEPTGRGRMKERLGLQGRTIITTFGFLVPRKGIEYMVRAMTQIVRRHPDALYLIVGKTHPELIRRAGEEYRAELITLVHACGLEDHVAFMDEYLSEGEIIDYFRASDVYVTPYLDPNQITSGTLAYALGAGKAIVSTPYAHAIEALADDRGLLVDFRNEQGLAEAVLRVLGDDELKRLLEGNAYGYGRLMEWPHIGGQVMRLYRAAAAMGGPPPPVAWTSAKSSDDSQNDSVKGLDAIASGADIVLASERDR